MTFLGTALTLRLGWRASQSRAASASPSAVYDQIRAKVWVEFADLGEQNLKNIALPVRAYAVVRDRSSPPTQAEPGALSLPHLSIVVLPFANLSSTIGARLLRRWSDREPDHRPLAHLWFARDRAQYRLHLQGQGLRCEADRPRIERALRAGGTVQRGGNRLRVNVQLVDAQTGHTYGPTGSTSPWPTCFDMQDEIVARLAGRSNANSPTQRRSAPNGATSQFNGLVFPRQGFLEQGMDAGPERTARSFFERALELDPANIEALVGPRASTGRQQHPFDRR